MIQNSTCPTDQEIWRRISYEPATQLSNMPLSIFNLIHFADKIGATDDILLQMICSYLKKYRPSILDALDQKKGSLPAVIESLAFQCTTDQEKCEVLQRLRSFSRLKGESFATCFTRFKSLHIFHLQLDQP